MTILLVILVLLLLFSGPYTGWHGYGWGPFGIVLVVLLILVLLGYV